jgi:hypothetical protein
MSDHNDRKSVSGYACLHQRYTSYVENLETKHGYGVYVNRNTLV